MQIEYLLGHGATSGLVTMDAFLADARLVPLAFEHLFSERVVRLDRIPLAYAPPAYLPDVGPLPARAFAHVTFSFDLDTYIARAIRAASDLDALMQLRKTLRGRCLSSPLNDSAGLARDVEAVYRNLRDALP